MLRAVIRRLMVDIGAGEAHSEVYTIDFEDERIEKALKSGGAGPGGYERHSLIGVEVLPAAGKENDNGPNNQV